MPVTCKTLNCINAADFPDSSGPLPSLFLSQAVYYTFTCPDDTQPTYTGSPSTWISLVGSQFVGAAGAFTGVTQVAANEAAQAALNAFVANAIALGQFTCAQLYWNVEVTVNTNCPEGSTATYTGDPLPAWITFVAPTWTGAAHTYSALSQAEADALADQALNDFVDAAVIGGDVTCVPDIDAITTAIVNRACGALIGNESDLDDLIVSIKSVYSKIYVMWGGYKLKRALTGSTGCVTMCDMAGANAKPTPEYWDLALNSSSGAINPVPTLDNITVSDANFSNKPSIKIADDTILGRLFYQLLTSTQILPQPFEVFVVAKFSGLTNGSVGQDERFRFLWDSQTTRSHLAWDENAPGPGLYQYAGSAVANMTAVSTPIINSPFLIAGIFNGASSNFVRYCGASTITSTTGNPGTAGFGGTNFRVGQLFNLTPLARLGDLALLFVTSSLTAPERATVVAALRAHYGV